MTLQLPPADPAMEDERTALAEQYDEIGRQLARLDFKAAAYIALHVWGAAELVVVKDNSEDSGDTEIKVLLAYDADGELLWFNADAGSAECWNHPGAERISDDRGVPLTDVDPDVVSAIEDHLVDGYDTARGITGPLDTTSDDYFDFDWNLLALDIAAALHS